MQSRFLKGMTLALLAIAIPVVALAQTARVDGLMIQGDYIKDYTNIFTYPSCVANVGNIVYTNLGTVTDYDYHRDEYFTTEDKAFGAVLGNLWDGRYGTFSFHMRQYTPALGLGNQPGVYDSYYPYNFGSGFATFDYSYLDPNYNPYEAFDIMWGKKINNMSVGLRVNRSFYKDAYTPSGTTYEGDGNTDRNVMGYGFGVGFDISPKTKAELSLLYQSRTFSVPTNTPAAGKDSEDGAGAYMFAARMMWQWAPNVQVVPVVRLYSFDLGQKFTPTAAGATVTTEQKLSGWQAGAAGNWTLNQNDLFVAGLTFSQNTWDQSTAKMKYTETIMPALFAALETHVNPWLTLRFGAQKGVFLTDKWENNSVTPNTTEKEQYSPFLFNMGAGVKLGTLQFDAVMAQDFFHNPASYISNSNNSYSPLFPQVTATYSF